MCSDELKLSSRSAESLPSVRKQPFSSASIDKILTARLESNGALCVEEGDMPPDQLEDMEEEGREDPHFDRSNSQDAPTDISDNTSEHSDGEKHSR